MGLGSGPGVKKAPDPGSPIRIRNTAKYCKIMGLMSCVEFLDLQGLSNRMATRYFIYGFSLTLIE
jgi:hypothetical protein